ncbi:HNH endonuclease signature motif containing protein [Ralstonia mannitolilytica]|uniref:HNH endonuclease signature motif containing protein n=1 Tax=Ralstonia mannitolilytica TaxID=105219 RepID=UPI003747C5C7
MPITAKELREFLHYDPETGLFTRLKTTSYHAKKGAIVGSSDLYGYKTVRIANASYKLHRLAWLYMHGEWPNGDVDHINGNRSDNRFCNLRAVSRQVNLQNCRKAASHNRSTGVLGVYPASRGKYSAALSINNKKKHLGTFNSIEEAHQAYLKAKRQLHEGCMI